jgi:carboxyl-terminal processing protease
LEALREEIVSRYYYESGEIEASLDNDPYVKKAMEVLNDPSAYHRILNNY